MRAAPSTIGLPLETRGMGAGGIGSHGMGFGGGGASRMKPDLMALVAGGAKACVAKHAPAKGWSVTVEVETTKDEVVDVSTEDKAAIAPCLVEAVWAVRLTAAFDLQREQFTLEFR